MTYRCRDCVYSEILDKHDCDMKCLKHNKVVKCMDNHCEDLILEPFMFLSHLCYNNNYEKYVKKGRFNWSDADEMARNLLDKFGFAGMIAPNEVVDVEFRYGPASSYNILQGSIKTLKEVMMEGYYGLPKELYDIRFLELRNFIYVQRKYNERFSLTSREEVEEHEKS